MLLAHMFNVLTGLQAMHCSVQRLHINPTKNLTLRLLLQMQFPAINSSNNEPTHYVTPKTISYIYWLVTDTMTFLPSYACNQRALRHEIMILEVLEGLEPAVFRHKLFENLTHYYEEVQSVAGSCGRPPAQALQTHDVCW